MMKQKVSRYLYILLLVALLTACVPSNPAVVNTRPLRVEYTNRWGDYTILVAQELGLFKKYDVDIEPVYFNVFSEAIPALATGAVDGGLVGVGDTININENSPVKIIAVYDDGGTNYVISSPEIDTTADLKGKKIGVPIGSIYELFIIQTLSEGGLTTRDVTLVNTQVEDVPNRLGSSIDAAYAWDPFASNVVAAGGNILFKSSENNSISPDVIVFREEVIQQRPGDIQAFLKAWFEAVEYRKANPEQANAIIAKSFEVEVNTLIENSYIYTLKDNRFFFSSQEIYDTSRLSNAIKTNADFLIRIGALSKKPAPNQLIDLSFIP